MPKKSIVVTECAATGACVPPGANHKQYYMRYTMQAGTALRRSEDGEWERVSIACPQKAKFRWEIAVALGKPVALFDGPDGREYAQPLPPDKDSNPFLTPKRRRAGAR